MNLKQKTFFFVALSMAALIVVYVVFSNYYFREQETQFYDERQNTATAISDEFAGFFNRGAERLQTIADLPGLVYGLQTVEANREGKQIPAWTTLHYLTFQSDVFTDGVYLLNSNGQVLWNEPPDVNLIETVFPAYEEIVKKLEDPAAGTPETAFLVWRSPKEADILIASPINDGEGRRVGILVGKTPIAHPAIKAMLARNPAGHGTTQLVDETGKVIISTDPKRQFITSPDKAVLVTAHVASSPWTVIIDQDAAVALSGIRNLRGILTAFGVVFILIAMGSLIFILRSFTRPVEVLTEAAQRIAEGDLDTRFTLDRNDEIGVLAKTLDNMKMKLKASYDLLLQSEKMALMGQVVAGIAHELNNPLTIVIGNVQLLQMREKNDKAVQLLGRVSEGAERASKIVKNLLTFARETKPERKLTDINSVVKKAIELRAYELKVSNIEVSTDLAEHLPDTMADPHQLQQVFLNLIINAEQAMIDAHGKGLLRIATRVDGQKIMVLFSDDGPGIPNEHQRRIFDPFFTTKPVGKGTGLGLSICQGIIGEHGGKIDVESTIGRGATFVIELPVQRWIPEKAAPAAAVTRSTVTRKRVLVVEDEAQIRNLFEDVLRAEGHHVESAENGRTALDMIDQKQYDLIISDVKMPELSGAELYAAIKRKGTALERRVIFVTGDLMNPETLQFVESTGRPWLRKPFDIESIVRTISDCLNENSTINTNK